jgi:Dyp-type peroxidase family
VLELDDIQGTVLRERSSPYAAAYFLLRIDNPAHGRELLRRLSPHVTTTANWRDPPLRAWLTVALSYAGLQALGVPQASLDSFPTAFRQGMAARAEIVGDVGDSSPEHWDTPLGSTDVHVALDLSARDDTTLRSVLVAARRAHTDLPGVSVIYKLDTPPLPTGRTHLGYVDGISQPTIEGSQGSDPVTDPDHDDDPPKFADPIRAREFLLGYTNQRGHLTPMPRPDVLGRNGTYVAFRKLHVRVAAFRRYLHDNADSLEEEELLAAKMVGRWRSGAPLILTPEHDDTAIAADPKRLNDFTYHADDPRGLLCPLGAHIRRMNPRDSTAATMVDATNHRILRRAATYGPALPEGVLDDDGVDRGIVISFIGADLTRQFEFLKSVWANDGNFTGLSTEKDPLAGNNVGTGTFTIPKRPIRRRLQQLPRFVATTGGEYLFMPGIRALNWLAERPS